MAYILDEAGGDVVDYAIAAGAFMSVVNWKDRISRVKKAMKKRRSGLTPTTWPTDEFKPVKMQVARPLSHGILIELDSETFRALTALALRKRMNPINLAKCWIIARLKEETERN